MPAIRCAWFKGLRQLMECDDTAEDALSAPTAVTPEAMAGPALAETANLPLAAIPEAARMDAYRRACAGDPLHWLAYTPSEQCFYQGDDPFFLVRQTPELLWGGIEARDPWPPLAELDAYSCVLDFCLLTAAPRATLEEQYRYVADQVTLTPVSRLALILPQGDLNGGPVYEDFAAEARSLLAAGDLAGLSRNAGTMLELSNPDLWIASTLRWLRLALETDAENRALLAALVESLSSLAPPDWSAVAAEGAGEGERGETPLPPPPERGPRELTADPDESTDQAHALAEDGVRRALPLSPAPSGNRGLGGDRCHPT